MTTQLTTQLANDLTTTLARLRTARLVNPKHNQPAPGTKQHTGCDICTAERRLNWLLDQPRRTRSH